MSLAGNVAMNVLRFAGRFWNIEITDPEKFLADARKKNAKHPFHKLKDHYALYEYYIVDECPVILISSKKTSHKNNRAILYLHGGITNDWEAELIVAREYANHTGIDVWYPVYPAVSEKAASDITEIIYHLYRQLAYKYGTKNIAVVGTSFGGTFGFSLICRINMANESSTEEKDVIQMPGIYIANSPGGVPQTEEDWMEMEKMSAYDPLINISAVKNIIPMQNLLKKDIPLYANSPAYGNFKQVPETYIYYAKETLAGNHLAYERGYADYGVSEKLHMHIQPGMMHGYSCLPVFPESKAAYGEQIKLLNQM